MSQEDMVAFAHRFAAAFNLGLEEFMAFHAEDVVHVTAPEWPERGTYRGREAVRGLWASILVEYEQYEIEVDDVIVLDENRVLSKVRLRARGAASGVETTTPVYTVGTERGGLVSRVEYFVDEAGALEAAGLRG